MAFSDNDIAFLIALGVFLVGALVYFIPTIVAAKKKSPKLKLIVLLDIFLAWTFVAWVVCLVLACKKAVPEKVETPPETDTEEISHETETEEPAEETEQTENSPEVETV